MGGEKGEMQHFRSRCEKGGKQYLKIEALEAEKKRK